MLDVAWFTAIGTAITAELETVIPAALVVMGTLVAVSVAIRYFKGIALG